MGFEFTLLVLVLDTTSIFIDVKINDGLANTSTEMSYLMHGHELLIEEWEGKTMNITFISFNVKVACATLSPYDTSYVLEHSWLRPPLTTLICEPTER